MLSYSDFQPYQSNKNTFKFKKLIPVSESPGLYTERFTKKTYQVTIFNNHQHFSTLNTLHKKNIFENIVGLFKKKNHTFYCFSTVNDYQLLSEFVQKYKGQKQLINELFCLQLVQQILNITKNLQSSGINLKILSPNYLVITENNQKRYRFKLKFPFCYDLFSNLSLDIIERQKQFCAPEILSISNVNATLKENVKFPKACLYSLGLVLLFSFGYRINAEERISALKKSKQFDIFLKALRKQIKIFLEGKFISKIIKILLQSNESVRDNTQTFQLKLKSPQLNSLRKYTFKGQILEQPSNYIPTIYSENQDYMKSSTINKTIEIRGSSYSTHQKSYQSQEKNSYNHANLFASFKKSLENFFINSSIKEVQEEDNVQNQNNQEGSNIASPIEINIDWDDDDNPIQSSNRSDSKRVFLQKSDKINKSKEKYLSSAHNQEKSPILQLEKSPQKYQKDDNVQIQLENMMMTLNRKRQSHDQSLFEIHMSQQNQQPSQQKPQILKYNGDAFQLSLSKHGQKQLKKKKSKSQLNDMKLIYDSQDEQQQQSQISQSQKNNGNYIIQMKQEFNKKSQAIFIVLLVAFLVYKVIDYFVK